ncbi:hypothetical protein GCM10010284_67930 [Streptomyces rubiginosohelvolus]|nr:hypothetical protein GCM10010284_67930 [Streptomyces rubiginosohelvolus]
MRPPSIGVKPTAGAIVLAVMLAPGVVIAPAPVGGGVLDCVGQLVAGITSEAVLHEPLSTSAPALDPHQGRRRARGYPFYGRPIARRTSLSPRPRLGWPNPSRIRGRRAR